jgi:hypothetical protein
MLSAYQQRLRERFLAAPQTAPPAPWRPVVDRRTPIGGLLGVGFAVAPDSGREFALVLSSQGLGVFDAETGEKVARDRDAEDAFPEDTPDLSCEGVGPLAGVRVRMAGCFGGGLHSGTEDGWGVDVVSPEWPNDRVLLSRGSGMPHDGPHGERWWHVFDACYSELRAAGFSPSGRTLAVATSSDLTLWTRRPDEVG